MSAVRGKRFPKWQACLSVGSLRFPSLFVVERREVVTIARSCDPDQQMFLCSGDGELD
jgi:hypothetical protein